MSKLSELYDMADENHVIEYQGFDNETSTLVVYHKSNNFDNSVSHV